MDDESSRAKEHTPRHGGNSHMVGRSVLLPAKLSNTLCKMDVTITSRRVRSSVSGKNFEEFRWALDDTVSVSLIKTFYERKIPLGAAHRAKMRDLRLYMLVGGMPQAVNTYLDTNDLSKVDTVKRNIIQLYSDDFLKLDPTGIM